MMQSCVLTRADARIHGQDGNPKSRSTDRFKKGPAKMSVDQLAAATTRVDQATPVEEEL